MKKLIYTTVLVLGGFYVHSQDVNPFQSIGKPGKILTLSKGKYTEVHINDSLQRIGSVIVNMNTGKIQEMLEADSLYSGTINPTVMTRWYSPDPLATKYPSMSPYNFVGNMPIIAIDPDGREIIIRTVDGSEYKYKPNMEIPKEASQYVQDVIMGLNYMYNNVPQGTQKIDFLVGLQNEGVNINQATSFGKVNSFDPVGENGTFANISFNASQADQLTDGKWQSPIVALAHELDHGHRYFYIRNFYNTAVTKNRQTIIIGNGMNWKNIEPRLKD